MKRGIWFIKGAHLYFLKRNREISKLGKGYRCICVVFTSHAELSWSMGNEAQSLPVTNFFNHSVRKICELWPCHRFQLTGFLPVTLAAWQEEICSMNLYRSSSFHNEFIITSSEVAKLGVENFPASVFSWKFPIRKHLWRQWKSSLFRFRWILLLPESKLTSSNFLRKLHNVHSLLLRSVEPSNSLLGLKQPTGDCYRVWSTILERRDFMTLKMHTFLCKYWSKGVTREF